jgi:hypothetical protein
MVSLRDFGAAELPDSIGLLPMVITNAFQST